MKRIGVWALAAGLLLLGTACNAGNPPVPADETVSTAEAVDSTTETTSAVEESVTEGESAATTEQPDETNQPTVTEQPTTVPVTTSQASTTTGTSGTRSFHEVYSENGVSVIIKEEYVDYSRQYTAADFPELHIEKIETLNLPRVDSYSPYMQSVFIYLTERGEQAVRRAVEVLSDNPLVGEASLIHLEYDE